MPCGEIQDGFAGGVCLMPAPCGDKGPNGFNDAEGPRALKKSVNGTEDAGSSEAENEPAIAAFQGIAYEHRGDGKEAEEGERLHDFGLGTLKPMRRRNPNENQAKDVKKAYLTREV
jgi:hypothetical protein